MEKLFVPYEIALKLKNLGFNEPCFAYHHEYHKFQLWDAPNESINYYQTNTQLGKNVAYPLYSQAFEFLKKNFDLRYKFEPTGNDNVEIFTWHIVGWKFFKKCNDNVSEFECLKELIKIAEL